MFIVASQLLI